MNLLTYPWLSIQRHSGKTEYIAPYQLTDNYQNDPAIALVVPRADFKGALLQFLIGLLQTAYNKDLMPFEWKAFLKNPPTPEELQSKLQSFAGAFEVTSGVGASFMQELDLAEGELKPIGGLLLEQPGENTLRENKDHFIKRGQINALCPICAVTALFTLQLNAPSGGAGHRTSIRGGGPLTTLVLDPSKEPTLWRTIWLNVLADEPLFEDDDHQQLSDIFPWLAPIQTSDKKTGKSTYASDVHPLQMFWAMPRRIRLDFNSTVQGECDICNIQHDHLLTQYKTKNYGIDYAGSWRHPLSPYSKKADGESLPLHPQPGGIGYKHWLNLVLGNSNQKIPAKVVTEYLRGKRQQQGQGLSIWAFGYDMDNMKARCWYESHLPLHAINEEYLPDFQNEVAQFIAAAELALSYAKSTAKKANGDLTRLEALFWSETEDEFYKYIKGLQAALENQQDVTQIRESWWGSLKRNSLSLFERVAMASMPIRAQYYKDLKNFLNGPKLRKSTLGLPSLKELKEQKDAVT